MTTSQAERAHGTRAKYNVEGCSCVRCRAANRSYENRRVRQRAYGRAAYVDSEPARQHVRALGKAGIGWRRAAGLAGLHASVVAKLLYGSHGARGQAPPKRIRPETERKILAVQATLDNLGANTLVDATGTHRRLQALVANGWSQAKLAARLGLLPGNFTGTMQRDQLHADTVRAVRRLYDELWNTPPAAGTHREKISVSRAKRYAADRRWVPPMAWDDDTIDDPKANGAGQGRQKLPPAAELLRLLERESKAKVAARFGVRPDAIHRALAKAKQKARAA